MNWRSALAVAMTAGLVIAGCGGDDADSGGSSNSAAGSKGGDTVKVAMVLDMTGAVGFAGVTHVVYTAVYELPGLVSGWRERDQMDTNLAMLRNLFDPLVEVAGGLRHVSLMQGTKAYGAHVHPIPVPARERFPRRPDDQSQVSA